MERQNCFPTVSRTIPPFFHFHIPCLVLDVSFWEPPPTFDPPLSVSLPESLLCWLVRPLTVHALFLPRGIFLYDTTIRVIWSRCYCSQSKFVALRAVGNSIASVNARHYSSKSKYERVHTLLGGGVYVKCCMYTQTRCYLCSLSRASAYCHARIVPYVSDENTRTIKNMHSWLIDL